MFYRATSLLSKPKLALCDNVSPAHEAWPCVLNRIVGLVNTPPNNHSPKVAEQKFSVHVMPPPPPIVGLK